MTDGALRIRTCLVLSGRCRQGRERDCLNGGQRPPFHFFQGQAGCPFTLLVMQLCQRCREGNICPRFLSGQPGSY